MPSALIQDISGDQTLELVASGFTRLPSPAFLNGWSHIRIALRVSTRVADLYPDVSGQGSYQRYYFGLCSDTTPGIGYATGNHFAGAASLGTYQVSITSGVYRVLLPMTGRIRVGETSYSTPADLNGSGPSYITLYDGATEPLFVDIFRSGTSFSFRLFGRFSSAASSVVVSEDDWETLSRTATPVYESLAGSAATVANRTITGVDEAANGAFKYLCVNWGPRVTPLRIQRLRLVRFA